MRNVALRVVASSWSRALISVSEVVPYVWLARAEQVEIRAVEHENVSWVRSHRGSMPRAHVVRALAVPR